LERTPVTVYDIHNNYDDNNHDNHSDNDNNDNINDNGNNEYVQKRMIPLYDNDDIITSKMTMMMVFLQTSQYGIKKEYKSTNNKSYGCK
jgi:hypothetical protein